MSPKPAAEITRAETGQRARLLRVRSYDVALDLTHCARSTSNAGTAVVGRMTADTSIFILRRTGLGLFEHVGSGSRGERA